MVQLKWEFRHIISAVGGVLAAPDPDSPRPPMAEYQCNRGAWPESALIRKKNTDFLKKICNAKPTNPKTHQKAPVKQQPTKLKKNLIFFFCDLRLSYAFLWALGNTAVFTGKYLNSLGSAGRDAANFLTTYLPRYSARYWIIIFPFLLGYEYCHFSAPPLCKRGGSFLAAGGSVWTYAAWLLQHKSCWYVIGTFFEVFDITKKTPNNWCYLYWNKYMGRYMLVIRHLAQENKGNFLKR